MQTVWRGTISFGLVAIPVRLHAATEEHTVSFRQVHAADGGRIRYHRVCEKDGEEVPYPDIAKGYELPDGEMVVLTDEDLKTLPLPTSKTIEVVRFVPSEQADPIRFGRGYYVRAEGPGAKPYVLLREALVAADRVAIVKVALRNRESLALLRVRDDVLVLHMMLWPDEIRSSVGIAPEGDDLGVRPQELAMAGSLIETLSGDFNPDDFTDGYRHAVEELVAAKLEGHEPAPAEPGRAETNVVDLVAALQASIDAAQQGSGGRRTAKKGGGTSRQTTRKRAASTGARGGSQGGEKDTEDAAARGGSSSGSAARGRKRRRDTA